MKAIVCIIVVTLLSFESFSQNDTQPKNKELSDNLPPPHATKSSMNFSNVTGWAEGQTPQAPADLPVSDLMVSFK